MPTTSSPTSAGRSTWSEAPRSNRALVAWIALAVLLTVLAFAGRLAGEESDPDRDLFFSYEFAAGNTVVYAFILGLTVWIASFFGRVREALGLIGFDRRWIPVAVGITVGALIAAVALEQVLPAGEEQGLTPEEWQPGRAAAFVLNSLVVALLVPFVEELFFRGLGVRVLAFLGGTVAVVVTALVFALAHGIPIGIPALGLFALALGWLRWTSLSVWPCVLAHALYNGLGVAAAAAQF